MTKRGKGTGASRLISSSVADRTLKADLERYRQKALELGASQAEAIPANYVEIDERVRLKCQMPPCGHYGRCANCPPHTPDPDYMRKALNRYHWAVLFKFDVKNVEDFTDLERYYPHGQKYQRSTTQTAAAIESLAFGDGYCFALGFGSGSCRDTLCDAMPCKALDSGRCQFLLRSRPSMEAVGINVCGVIERVNWQMFSIYRNVDPDAVACAISVGIVFIH